MLDTTREDGLEVAVTRDLPFGEGPIGHGSAAPAVRTLTMDAYAPVGAAPDGAPRPALILAHGGAYHRGTKETDLFEQDGRRNTAVADYCRRFAARGFACFSVGYRLTQERPAPQRVPIRRERGSVPRGRIDHVRGLMGLPTATDGELIDGMEAAFADVAAACRFVHAQSARFGVDPARIAIGGFSAGASSAAYAVYALGAPAAAVVSLSGGMDAADADHYVHGAHGRPPVLLFSAEHDLPGIAARTGALADAAARAGLGMRRYAVPGAPHFYDRDTEVVLEASTLQGGAARCTVESAIADFLARTLVGASVDVAMLQAFAEAWSRHDIDALMSMMTDDCVFHTSGGPDASGTRLVGRDAVRAGFVKAWTDFPDACWTRPSHVVAGNRGVSEWTFTGTRASDGVRVEVDGCDVFTFRGPLIRVKDSFRKQRG